MGTAPARAGTRERARLHGRGRSTAACAPAFDVAANPATLRALMAGADAGTRERLADAVQRRHGNAALQRLLTPGAALPVQRWAVTLPRGTADCERVVSYMNANSPYRADSGWARTNVSFSWGGDPSFKEADGVITATVANPTVTKTVSVDMPSWAPTDVAMARGWSAMTGDLRAHEARHEAIATTWEATLRSRLTSLSVTVAHRTTAAFTTAVRAEWRSWIAEHQAAQTAIDPYTATLDCSGGSAENEAAGLEGDLGAAGED
jgi:predicted secreted Zn-dependent protease